MTRRAVVAAVLGLLLGALAGCGTPATSQGPVFGSQPSAGAVPVYRFAVHPLYNPTKLSEAYGPLIGYLNARLQGAQLVLEASVDYADFEAKYGARKPEVILPNPWQTLQAMKVGYAVVAMAGNPADFKGIFVVRKDSGITTPADLKGKAVSYPSKTALAACIMPQYFLYRHGVNPTRDIETRYVGSQESSIMNAYLGLTAAGATWPPPWRAFQQDHPKEAAELTVIWETESLVNNAVMVRDDIPVAVRDQLRSLLAGLTATAEGKTILDGMETERFTSATDADYDVVRDYVAAFERDVRPVAGP